jgi:hypothetical protein
VVNFAANIVQKNTKQITNMKSKRNRMAGEHPSYDKLGMSEERKKKKLAYDKKYQDTEERVNYREKLNKANRKAGTYGNGDNIDMSHTKAGSMVAENMKSNRSRNGQDGKSTKK